MSILAAILLGLLQGVTEFLPISSSGHLAILGRGVENFGLYAIVMFHLGTLFSILAYYRKDVASLVGGAVRLAAAAGGAAFRRQDLGRYIETDAGARVALLVIVGCIPTGIIGLALRHLAEYAASPGHAKIVGALFIITAAFLYQCDRFPIGTKGIGGARLRDALVVGLFQGMAVLPGLSRSGLTIFAGVMRGIERRDAARLSFLMAIPALVAAVVLELPKGSPSGGVTAALVGAAVAFVSGYASIIFLLRVLTNRKMRYFAGYLLTLGVLVVTLMR